MSHTCDNCQTMENTFNATLELVRQQREIAHDEVVKERLVIAHLREKLSHLQTELEAAKKELELVKQASACLEDVIE